MGGELLERAFDLKAVRPKSEKSDSEPTGGVLKHVDIR